MSDLGHVHLLKRDCADSVGSWSSLKDPKTSPPQTENRRPGKHSRNPGDWPNAPKIDTPTDQLRHDRLPDRLSCMLVIPLFRGAEGVAKKIPWQCSWRSSGELSGPFCLEIPHVHVKLPQNRSCECSFELFHSQPFFRSQKKNPKAKKSHEQCQRIF